MNRPLLSVIIPWYDYPELELTLAANKPTFDKYDLEVIIVNVGGDPTIISLLANARTRVCSIPALKFRRSLGLNIGAHIARGDYLFFLDPDIILQEDFISAAISFIKQHKIISIDRVLPPGAEKDDTFSHIEELVYYMEIVANGAPSKVRTKRTPVSIHSKSGNGLLFVAKNDFLSVNGMNCFLEFEVLEDIDLLFRLQIILGLKQTYIGTVKRLSDNYVINLPDENTDLFTAYFQLCKTEIKSGAYHTDIQTWEREIDILDMVPHA